MIPHIRNAKNGHFCRNSKPVFSKGQKKIATANWHEAYLGVIKMVCHYTQQIRYFIIFWNQWGTQIHEAIKTH